MTDEQQIAALRETIQQAARANRRLNILMFGWLALDPLWLVLLFLVHRGNAEPAWFLWLVGIWFSGLPVLLWVNFSFLRRVRSEIRKLWDPLTAAERAEAMKSFGRRATWPSATKEIMDPFLRQGSGSSELTPAASPDARRDEVSPAERVR